MMHFSRLLPVLCAYLQPAIGLQIATSLLWIEHTPQPYTIDNFYNGSTRATLVSGGVADIGTNKAIDLAANAETQGLKQYANHRNIRLIYIICEVAYRIVADKRRGIKKLEDLKGKKIGTFSGTSANVFVHNMMSSVRVQDNEYSLESGNFCMKTPCKDDTFVAKLAKGSIDAVGVWETTPELGIRALGDNAVVFKNASVYREVYALYSTTEALNDKKRRADIVEFVRGLNKTLDIFTNQPKEKGIYAYAGGKVGADPEVLEAVWDDHKWSKTWGGGLIDYLVEEDKYLAKKDNRAVIPRKDLEKFLDTSVIDEL